MRLRIKIDETLFDEVIELSPGTVIENKRLVGCSFSGYGPYIIRNCVIQSDAKTLSEFVGSFPPKGIIRRNLVLRNC